MKQKLLILFLALAANAGIAFAETYSGTCGTNLTWTFTSEDGVLSISGEGGMYNWYSNPPVGSSTAPTYAPWHYYYVTKVVINDGATSIGRHAFYGCSNLTSVTIPNSVTSIANAFDDCHITEILFTGTLEQWCTKSWNPSSISSSYRLYINNEEMIDVIIPESVTSIGGCAFQGCSSLTSVTIPNSVTTIGNSAFYGCSSLTSITIPNSVTSIGQSAFRDCSRLTSVTIPNSVTSIGDYVFNNCSSLTSVTIPNGVTSIGDYAFYGCSSLTSVTIPNRVKTIAFNAFYDCPIAEIRFMGTLEQWCKKLWGHFSHPMYRLYINNEELTDVVIPESVKSIKDYTFQNCSSLTSVTIPNSVTSIGKSAFEDCSSLTSVTIGKSVTSIGEKAFNGCSSLTTLSLNAYAIASQAYSSYYGGISRFFPNSSIQNLIIGDAITAIGQYAFWGCGSLTSVTISNSVTSIGKEALGGCSEIYFTGDLEQWINKQWNPTQITSKKYILYIEKQKTSNIVVPNSVTSIRDSTFYNCSSLTSVTIPNNVTSIGQQAFSGCSSLTKVVIGDGATSIGQEAFYGCTYLEDITIGSGINVDNGIGENAFNGCRYLLSVTCKADYPPVINENVFQDCGVLGGIDLFVPEESVKRYKKATVWSEFNIIGANIVQCSETKTPDGTTICSSELPFVWEGLTFTEAGSKTKTLQSVGGCDSVVTFTLSVYPEITNYETKVLWDDELPYTWEGITFTEAGTETKTLTASTGCDSTVTFTLRVRERHITLQENEDAGYYDLFTEDYNGQTVTTATLNRQFGFGKWATLCLPFNVNKSLMIALGLNGRVYEFRHADLWDDVAQIYFAPAQSIEAGKGYIVNANAKLALKTSFVFPNVTINTDSDTGDITTLTGYNDGTGHGNLFLVGTLRTGLLQGSIDGNTYLGLKNNMLYYPNSASGTAIRAYRGFFRSTEPMTAQKVRIIVEGEASEELLIDNGELMVGGDALNDMQTTIRKYIRNGILLIERNGKTYTAQGQRID